VDTARHIERWMKWYRRYQERPESAPVHWRDQTHLSAQKTVSPSRSRIPAPDELARGCARAAEPAPQRTPAPGRFL